mmetsp:Transcript_9258/g.20089  ORF Transcript_9258/g.20089 Transcript_9258/m.20089 type:complete len:254 (-) Transcript_9258:1350-2111(-)
MCVCACVFMYQYATTFTLFVCVPCVEDFKTATSCPLQITFFEPSNQILDGRRRFGVSQAFLRGFESQQIFGTLGNIQGRGQQRRRVTPTQHLPLDIDFNHGPFHPGDASGFFQNFLNFVALVDRIVFVSHNESPSGSIGFARSRSNRSRWWIKISCSVGNLVDQFGYLFQCFDCFVYYWQCTHFAQCSNGRLRPFCVRLSDFGRYFEGLVLIVVVVGVAKKWWNGNGEGREQGGCLRRGGLEPAAKYSLSFSQ